MPLPSMLRAESGARSPRDPANPTKPAISPACAASLLSVAAPQIGALKGSLRPLLKPLRFFAYSTTLSCVVGHRLYLLKVRRNWIQAMDDLRPDAMRGNGSVGPGFDQTYIGLSSDASGMQPGHDDRTLNDSAPVGRLRRRSSGPQQHHRPKRIACKECRQAKVCPQ
jgi:hypothetical protein